MDNTFEISSTHYDPTDISATTGRVNPTPEPGRKPDAASGQRPAAAAPRKAAAKPRPKADEAPAKPRRDGGRWAMFFGIVLLLAAAYMLIASISHFANGADDQSIVQSAPYSQVVANAHRVGNAAGPAGAVLSHVMLSRWLGLGSFILIFYIGAVGLSLLKVRHFRFWDLTYKSLLCAITLSVLAGFLTYSVTSYDYWGGAHGHFINELVMKHAGLFGAIALNILLVAAVALVFLREIQMAISLYRSRIQARRERIERERAEAEARRRVMETEITDPDLNPDSSLTDAPDEPADAPEAVAAPEAATTIAEATTAEQPEPRVPVMAEIPDAPLTPAEAAADTLPDATAEAPASVPETAAEAAPAVEAAAAAQQPINVNITIAAPEAHAPEALQTPDASEAAAPATPSAPAPEVQAPKTVVTDTPQPDMTIHRAEEIKAADEIATDIWDPTATLRRFHFPDIELLEDRRQRTDHVDVIEQEENKERLTKTLASFGVEISEIRATIGPTITRYEIIPAPGVRTRSVRSLGDDLALSLSALGIRIIAPIPGQGTIGIEVPNKQPQIVSIRSILTSEAFQSSTAELPIALGTTIDNKVFVTDLAKLPHLLVAGATGRGKSVGLNTIMASLLYKRHPAELKFVLIDPKRVELSLYKALERHYLAALPGEDPIITDTAKVVTVLNSLCIEMENRLSLLQEAGVRNIKEYNEKFLAKRLNPAHHRFLPYIVLIIDEFADIILTAGREVEAPVSRLAAVARAAGIHLIIATQRPTVNVITGGIKTNIPGRIAFGVYSAVDSKTILDQTGANLLSAKGDMLFSQNGVVERMQCAFISTEECNAICDSISRQIGYDEPYQLPDFVPAEAEGAPRGSLTDIDPLYPEVARMIVESGRASTTDVQRKFQVGFGRAARIMDQLEAGGVVGPQNGPRPRSILMDIIALDQHLSQVKPS